MTLLVQVSMIYLVNLHGVFMLHSESDTTKSTNHMIPLTIITVSTVDIIPILLFVLWN